MVVCPHSMVWNKKIMIFSFLLFALPIYWSLYSIQYIFLPKFWFYIFWIHASAFSYLYLLFWRKSELDNHLHSSSIFFLLYLWQIRVGTPFADLVQSSFYFFLIMYNRVLPPLQHFFRCYLSVHFIFFNIVIYRSLISVLSIALS